MKKRFSVAISTMSVSACALMSPVSVQGMRGGGILLTQFLSPFIAGVSQRDSDSDIGKAFHEAALLSDFERISTIDSYARRQDKNMIEEIRRFYQNNPFSFTFLHECEDPELVRFAVENGLQELIDNPTSKEITPLMSVRNPVVAQALIDNGANVNHITSSGTTPLFCAKTKIITQILIDNGANVNHVNKTGKTPLFTAKTGEIAQVLIDRGASINHVDQNGQTPLFEAKTREVAQVLIDHGADVNQADFIGQTPLFGIFLNREVAQVLIDHGANVNHVNLSGQTPIFWAKTEEIAQVLISSGADVNHVTLSGRTPLMSVCNRDIAQILIDSGANIDDLRYNNNIFGMWREQLLRNNAR